VRTPVLDTIIGYIIIYIVFSVGIHYKQCVRNNMPPLRLIILHNHYCRQRIHIYNISNSNVDHFDGQHSSFPSTPPLDKTIIHLHGPRLFDIHRHRSVYHIIYNIPTHIYIYIYIVPTPYSHTLYYRILIIIAHHIMQYHTYTTVYYTDFMFS